MPSTEPATPSGKDKSSGQNFLGLLVLTIAAFAAAFGSTHFLSAGTATPIVVAASSDLPTTETSSENFTYVELPEIIITIGSEPADRFLKINLSVIATKDGAKKVDELTPVLIDTFNMYFRAIEVTDFENPDFYAKMREQLTHRSELILGAKTSKGILITEFLLR